MKHTGMEFDIAWAYVWPLRDGKVIHIGAYLEQADALNAARLAE